jgi:hypothetical protein
MGYFIDYPKVGNIVLFPRWVKQIWILYMRHSEIHVAHLIQQGQFKEGGMDKWGVLIHIHTCSVDSSLK